MHVCVCTCSYGRRGSADMKLYLCVPETDAWRVRKAGGAGARGPERWQREECHQSLAFSPVAPHSASRRRSLPGTPRPRPAVKQTFQRT